jgi:hypothetical protein
LAGLVGEAAIAQEVVVQAGGTRVVGGEESGRAVVVIERPQIRRAREDVVPRLIGIRARAKLDA